MKQKNTTGKKSKYAVKKEQQRNGTYHGTSPFFSNIPEFTNLLPLSSYPHLRKYNLPANQ